jgi:acetyl-CoA synthetase
MVGENSITSKLIEKRQFRPSKEIQKLAYIKSFKEYKRLYNQSIKNPSEFWGKFAEEIEWFKKWKKIFSSKKKPFVKWFEDGKLNVSYNCLDRHVKTWRKNKAALIWEGNFPGESKTYTYQQLLTEVCKFANLLKKLGVKKGDRVSIYLPMIPELAIAMLACTRIGAIHSIVFGGFSANALQKRINDCKAKILITADGSYHGEKIIPLKSNADEALKNASSVKKVIIVKRTNQKVNIKDGRDLWWHELMQQSISLYCKPEVMDAEDPLFILYTSGTTGTPKGILHTTGGYLVYVHNTFKYIFDYKEEDIYWCTADIGWITGHSYIIYGPLSNGATSLMFEGVPTYPQPDRFWDVVEKYKVNIFYTAPTAIRAIAKFGDKWPNKHDLSSLRLLGSVGEPINSEAWLWYYNVIGKKRCPIMDTWWQTETGGILITPLPCFTLKPGSATFPFFGIKPLILKDDGKKAKVNEGGYLVIEKSWPAIGRTVWKNPARYINVYFSKFKNLYLTGDGAKIDKQGYYWIMGRLDDVINVSGHRIGTAEVESVLDSNRRVAESAVVGVPHPIKGESLYAFITLNKGIKPSPIIAKELINHVANAIGHFAKPEKIQFAESLPKTRSGKIMRRILKAIAQGRTKKEIGDTTTLADPSVIDNLIKERV